MTNLFKRTMSYGTLLVAATAMSAQGLDAPTLKLAIGKPTGEFKDVTGNKMTIGLDGELSYKLGGGSSIVGTLGYRFMPGDGRLVSTYTNTRVNPPTDNTYVEQGAWETRVRKIDVKGFQAGILYRFELEDLHLYFQGGARVGRNETTVTDTGTIRTTSGDTVTGIQAIADKRSKTVLSPGFLLGAGYRVGERYAVELNLHSLKAENPDLAATTVNAPTFKKSFSGMAAEFNFAIRF